MPRKQSIFDVKAEDLKYMIMQFNQLFTNIPKGNGRYKYNKDNDDILYFISLENIIKEFEDHYDIKLQDLIKSDKMVDYTILPYELADLFCLMARIIYDADNLFIKTRNKQDFIPDIASFVKYNKKVMQGIDKLPVQVKNYVKKQKGYRNNYYLTKRISALIERFEILIAAAEDSTRSIDTLIEKLDDCIDWFVQEIPNNDIDNVKKGTPHYFEKVLADTFKKLAEYHPSRKSPDNKERRSKYVYENYFKKAFGDYFKVIRSRSEGQKDHKLDLQLKSLDENLNDPFYRLTLNAVNKENQELIFDPQEFCDIFSEIIKRGLNEANIIKQITTPNIKKLKDSDIISLIISSDSIMDNLKKAGIIKACSIQELKKVGIENIICKLKESKLTENELKKINILKKFSLKSDMKDILDLAYKNDSIDKYYREIYLSSIDILNNKNVEIKYHENTQLLKVNRLIPYLFDYIAKGGDLVYSEFKKKFNNTDFWEIFEEENEVRDILKKARRRLNEYLCQLKYYSYLLILYNFIIRIYASENNDVELWLNVSKIPFSDEKQKKFVAIIKSSFQDIIQGKILILSLKKEWYKFLISVENSFLELENRFLIKEKNNSQESEHRLDWENILTKEEILRLKDFLIDVIQKGPLKGYYSELETNLNIAIKDIAESYNSESFLNMISDTIQSQATKFLIDVYIETELSKSQKYYAYKNRYKNVFGKIRWL